MGDLRQLKKDNRIEDVLEETGYPLDRQQGKRYWLCVQTPDLKVDLEKQHYYWSSKGEEGDVITWLEQRFNWETKRAISYLSARASMAPAERPRFPAQTIQDKPAQEKRRQIEEQSAVQAQVSDPVGDLDWRLRSAERLLHDYPDGFGRIRTFSYLKLREEIGGIPKTFLPVVGEVDEDNHCSWCLEDFHEWEDDGAAYLAIAIGKNYNLTEDTETSGIYCKRCVQAFKRWIKGLGLLRDFKFLEGGAAAVERGAGAGKDTQSLLLFSDPTEQ